MPLFSAFCLTIELTELFVRLFSAHEAVQIEMSKNAIIFFIVLHLVAKETNRPVGKTPCSISVGINNFDSPIASF